MRPRELIHWEAQRVGRDILEVQFLPHLKKLVEPHPRNVTMDREWELVPFSPERMPGRMGRMDDRRRVRAHLE